jgi:hypothetical protein
MANAYIVPYLKGKVPTGFIQYEMPYYMANGREYFDQGFQLTYGNPYAPYGTPAIYFQPQILLLGCLHKLGLDPGITINLFGIVALLFATWVSVRFYREVVGFETAAKRLGLVCFFWGGGALVGAGLLSVLYHHDIHRLWEFDSSNGWWMFNFGRNLVHPTEAYYHGLFLLSLLFLIKRKFVGTLVVAALLSMSHPFTGLSLLLILVAYSIVELKLRSQTVSPAVLLCSILLTISHLGYYWIFLNRFADHRALRDQWWLPWLYGPKTYVPALVLVAGLTLARFVRPGLRELLRAPRNRLFLVWFLVVFALSQHNLFIRPFQPIHFTHGYDWIALFFLSAPLLMRILGRLLAIPSPALRRAAVAMLVLVFLSDNATWLGSFVLPYMDDVAAQPGAPAPEPISLTRDQSAVLSWLGSNAGPRDLVVCDDLPVSYLVSTYTAARSWMGHRDNTPFWRRRRAETNEALRHGRVLRDWESIRVFYVGRRDHNPGAPPGTFEVYQNSDFIIWDSRRGSRVSN